MFGFHISPSLFRLQDQLIAELERMQLELDQLRSRPGGAYSRLVQFGASTKVSVVKIATCQNQSEARISTYQFICGIELLVKMSACHQDVTFFSIFVCVIGLTEVLLKIHLSAVYLLTAPYSVDWSEMCT